MTLVVRGERVVLPDGMRSASIHILDGRIVEVGAYDTRAAGVRTIDAGDRVVLPGLVDTHVHINDPGRADWEGFGHATRAAAAGGVTTLIDMPLNSIPATTSVEGLDAKLRAAANRCYVDVGFWGGVVPGNSDALPALAEGGVLGFKCFLVPSGVDEFPPVSEHDLRAALPTLGALGLPLLVHAELPRLLREPEPNADQREYRTWLDTRPPASELAAVRLCIELSRETGAALHIVHLAAAGALELLRDARRAGVSVTVETCPHYLTFVAEDIREGATAFKCAPPIRERDHRERLWTALTTGDIDLVATDHSPAPPGMKCAREGDFLRAWGGIASLQVGLAVVWTQAASRGIPLESVARWMSERPAVLAGLHHTKGAIAVGRDADLVLWNPDAETIVDPARLYHRHPVTPYRGMRLRGQVQHTLLRGQVVFDSEGISDPPLGRPILGRDSNARIAR